MPIIAIELFNGDPTTLLAMLIAHATGSIMYLGSALGTTTKFPIHDSLLTRLHPVSGRVTLIGTSTRYSRYRR